MRETKKDNKGLFSLTAALILLISPNVGVFDILPDFIAYFIIAKKLGYACECAPFFEEAREAVRKLALVTLIKLPASLLMTSFRAENYSDNDIRALFAITFAVFEAVLLFPAVKNLFAGFSYLGQRSENTALIKSFYTNKKCTKMMSPDSLAVFTYAFMLYKCLMSVLPETFLLTKIITTGEAERYFNIARLYPYAVVFGIVSVLTLGIIWIGRFKKYILAFNENGGFVLALDSMLDGGRRAELDVKKRVEGMKFGLLLLAVSSVLTLDLRFDNLNNIDLLPSFFLGFIMMFAGIRLSIFTDKGCHVKLLGSLFTVCAFLRFLFEFSFFEKYGYELLSINANAKRSYILLIGAFVLETLFFIIFASSVGKILRAFVIKNTGIEPSNERYSRQDAEYHKLLTKKVYIFTGLSIALWLSKLAECILRFFSKNTYVSWEVEGGDMSIIRPDTGLVSESPLPWFGVAVLIISIIYIIYSFYFTSELREDVEMKYIEN